MTAQPGLNVYSPVPADPRVAISGTEALSLPTIRSADPRSLMRTPTFGLQTAVSQRPSDHEPLDAKTYVVDIDDGSYLETIVHYLKAYLVESPSWPTGQLMQSLYWPSALGDIHNDDHWLKVYEAFEERSSTNTILRDALGDLEDVTVEAQEDQLPVPSATAFANARRILRQMYRIFPHRYEIYPMPDGEIAIDGACSGGYSVVLLCDSDGAASCLVNMNGARRRASYSDAGLLPDEFVRKALQELAYRHSQAP